MTATFYKARLVKNGPLCGVKIWHGHPIDPDTCETLTERPAIWRAELNGAHVPVDEVAIVMDNGRPIVKGDEITETDYRFFCADASWVQQHAPHLPEAKPREMVDLNKIRSLF